jgi:hypothetical protein
MDSPVAANIFGTVGAVLWSLQVREITVCDYQCSTSDSGVPYLAAPADLEELAPP